MGSTATRFTNSRLVIALCRVLNYEKLLGITTTTSTIYRLGSHQVAVCSGTVMSGGVLKTGYYNRLSSTEIGYVCFIFRQLCILYGLFHVAFGIASFVIGYN